MNRSPGNRSFKPAERPPTDNAKANQLVRRKMTEAEVICGKDAETLRAEQMRLKAAALARFGKRAA